MPTKINPFDILSGKVVKNEHGTFWFEEAGCNVGTSGRPDSSKLHNENGPAAVWNSGVVWWCYKGLKHRKGGPAIIWQDGSESWYQYGSLIRPPMRSKKIK